MIKEKNKKLMVRRQRCDKPMAEKKGLLDICDHKCSQCIACIVELADGTAVHRPIHGEQTLFQDRKCGLRMYSLKRKAKEYEDDFSSPPSMSPLPLWKYD